MQGHWESGIEFGRALERLTGHERRMDRIEADHDHLRTEVTQAKTLAIRVGLVLVLWLAGLAVAIPSEKGGEFLAAFLKAYLK